MQIIKDHALITYYLIKYLKFLVFLSRLLYGKDWKQKPI